MSSINKKKWITKTIDHTTMFIYLKRKFKRFVKQKLNLNSKINFWIMFSIPTTLVSNKLKGIKSTCKNGADLKVNRLVIYLLLSRLSYDFFFFFN